MADAPTLTKVQANYRRSTQWSRRCGKCVMYHPGPGTAPCDLVKGSIEPYKVCDYFEAPAVNK